MSLIGLNKQVSTDNTNWYKYVGLIPTQNIWYKFTVSNDGETTLNNIVVTDPTYPPLQLFVYLPCLPRWRLVLQPVVSLDPSP